MQFGKSGDLQLELRPYVILQAMGHFPLKDPYIQSKPHMLYGKESVHVLSKYLPTSNSSHRLTHGI